MSTSSAKKSDLKVVEKPASKYSMKYLIKALIKYNASDLHLKYGRPPLYRINGKLIPAKMDSLKNEDIKEIIYSVLTAKQKESLEDQRSIDLSFRMGNYGRFRCSVFFQKSTLSCVVRMIPINVPTLDDLGLPSVLKEMCHRPRGLILFTGPTGSGKSTSLAAMVQYINQTRHQHILMLEDPIEFIFRDDKSSITQREVGIDTKDFSTGLFEGLRQDPDVIVIGEMRDPEVIKTALTAAETGHLVISTLHTKDSQGTIERILDVFSNENQNQVRIELASSLVGIVSQHLLLKEDGEGRVPAFEIMVKSPMIENIILKGDLEKLNDAISGSNNYYKMQTLNQSLESLVRKGVIKKEEALKASPQPSNLKLRLDGVQHDNDYQSNHSDSDEEVEIEQF